MTEIFFIVLVISLWLLPSAVRGLARIIFTAYFEAKHHFVRRQFNGTDQTKNSSKD